MIKARAALVEDDVQLHEVAAHFNTGTININGGCTENKKEIHSHSRNVNLCCIKVGYSQKSCLHHVLQMYQN